MGLLLTSVALGVAAPARSARALEATGAQVATPRPRYIVLPPGAQPLDPRRPGDWFLQRPECGTMKYFGEGFGAGIREMAFALYGVFDTLLPDVGVVFSHGRSAAPTLSWAFAVPFGPTLERRVRRFHCSPDDVRERKAFQLTPELGITFSDPLSGWLRVGYAVLLQPKRVPVGVGLGLGPTFEWRSGRLETWLSPELTLRFGRCCDPGYAAFTVRYERSLRLATEPRVLLKFGFTYF